MSMIWPPQSVKMVSTPSFLSALATKCPPETSAASWLLGRSVSSAVVAIGICDNALGTAFMVPPAWRTVNFGIPSARAPSRAWPARDGALALGIPKFTVRQAGGTMKAVPNALSQMPIATTAEDTLRPKSQDAALVSGGHLVAKALKNEGVDTIFTLCGGHIIDIYDGCVDEGIRIIDCLLYTSDAADDLLCVDLGGRRIIKKKKNI